MKLMKPTICFIILVVLFLNGCSDNKKELTRLMNAKDYKQAKTLLKTFSAEELNTPEVLSYRDTLTFIDVDSSIAFYSSKNDFTSIENSLNSSISAITNSPKLKDSLFELKQFYSFKKAQYLKRQITGVWKGHNVGNPKLAMEVRLEALTSTSFQGIMGYRIQDSPWQGYGREFIEGGNYDGYELSAQLYDVMSGRTGSFKGNEYNLTGKIVGDTLYLTVGVNTYYMVGDNTYQYSNHDWILKKQ